MYGNSTSAEIEQIDHTATISEYERQITAAIREAYPEIEVVHEYGSYAGRSIIVEMDDWDENLRNEISENASEIVAQIYNNGTFWVSK